MSVGRLQSITPFFALMWRRGDDWGWLSSLDGNRDCTTTHPARRLRYATREAAMVALWKFRRDNRHQDGAVVRLVRVRVRLDERHEK